MKKYKFRKYRFYYPLIFKKIKKRLLKKIPKSDIYHIGSTSVKGLDGKGIVDLLILVNKSEINKAKKRLVKEGYELSKTGGDSQRLFFEKDIFYLGKKRIHLHLTYKGSSSGKEATRFRDILRTNKRLKDRYEKTKREAIKYSEGEGKRYRNYKNKIIKDILGIK